MPFSASAVANPNPGSPVFSPSRRLPPSLLSFPSFNKDTPEPHHHIHIYASASALPGSPLRPPSLLRAQHQHRREAACSPSPCKPTNQQQFAAVTTAITPSPSPSRLVNRGRPPPLLVPAVTTLQLQEQEEVEEDETQETAGHGFAAYCRKGKGRRRVHMEDRHVAAVGLGGDPHTAFFGVFDGHGGKAAAEFAANNMPRIMAQELQQQTRMTTTTAVEEEAVRRAYLRTDADFSSTSRAGGACCATALLRQGRLVVSNAGDCRAVLCRAGKAHPLTDDHRASREDERRRIESQGGLVLDCRGTWRVQGTLAVSRGIGDAHLKPWVVPEPDTTTLPVDARCEFLVLASDGLWDKVGEQEAVDVARPLCCTGGQLSAACRRLVELATSRGSTDDITVLIVSFSAMRDGLYS